MHSLIHNFDVTAADIAATIDASGCACIPNVVSDEWLRLARISVANYLPLNGENELLVIDPAAVRDSVAHQLVADQRIQSLLESVAAVGYPAVDTENLSTENELRIVVGRAVDEPPWLHYDGPVVTIVVPIVMPLGAPGNAGELILWPNRRPYRRMVITNIVEKFICQNGLYGKWFVRRHGSDPDAVTFGCSRATSISSGATARITRRCRSHPERCAQRWYCIMALCTDVVRCCPPQRRSNNVFALCAERRTPHGRRICRCRYLPDGGAR